MHQTIGLVVLTAIVLLGAAVPASQNLQDGNWGGALGLVAWPYIVFFVIEWAIYRRNRHRRQATIGDGYLPGEVYSGVAIAVLFFVFALAGRNH